MIRWLANVVRGRKRHSEKMNVKYEDISAFLQDIGTRTVCFHHKSAKVSLHEESGFATLSGYRVVSCESELLLEDAIERIRQLGPFESNYWGANHESWNRGTAVTHYLDISAVQRERESIGRHHKIKICFNSYLV